MSQTSSGSSFTLPWFAFFVVIKIFGSSLAAWSWWWCFLPFVPVIWLICRKFGFL